MKSLLKICEMKSINDVNKIRSAISYNEGVIACHINKDKKEVEIIYDDYFVSLDKIIDSIERIGYTVL